jgi:hypothetical protein
MDDDARLADAQRELMRHQWDTFVENPPSIAKGGKGVTVPGCTACKIRIYTMNQFMSHLAIDVLPRILQDFTREVV